MTVATRISLTPELVHHAGQYLANALHNSPADAAALFTLSGQCVWASDPAFMRIAPNVARIGIASLRLWAKSRTGRLEQIGLMTSEGLIDLVFVAPIASLLVVSRKSGQAGWPEGEPGGLMQALDL